MKIIIGIIRPFSSSICPFIHPLIYPFIASLVSNFDKEDKKNSQSPMLQKMNTTAGIIGGRKTLISYSLRPVRPIKLASLKKESS